MEKRQNKKVYIILFIVLFILAIFCLFIPFISASFPLLDENNTTEIEATFLSYKIDDNLCEIETTEYLDKIKIRDIREINDIKLLNSIQPNGKILFRVENVFKDNLEEIDFIYICSLTYDNMEILTLEDINNSSSQAMQRIKITSYVFSGLLIIGAFVNLFIILIRN